MVISKKVLLATVLSFVALQMYGVGGPGGGVAKKLAFVSQASGSETNANNPAITGSASVGNQPTSGNYVGLGWCLSSGDTVETLTIIDTTGQQYIWSDPNMTEWEFYQIGSNPVASFDIVTSGGADLTVKIDHAMQDTLSSVNGSATAISFYAFDTASASAKKSKCSKCYSKYNRWFWPLFICSDAIRSAYVI